MNDHTDDRTDETTDSTTGSGADALAGVAAMLRGDDADGSTDETSTGEADDEGAVETAADAPDVESSEAAADSPDDEFSIEVDEDSPFAAAAAIFQRDEPEAEAEAGDEAEATEEVEVEATEEVEVEATDEGAVTEGDDDSDEETDTSGDESPEPVAEEADAPADDDSDGSADDEAEASADDEGGEDEEDEEELLPPASPYDLPGGWYVVHSYSGYENKVKANLSTRIKSMHMEDSIFDIVIPMEEVVEIKSGRKVTVDRKQFPGYILVRMYMDDDSWGVVRNTPGVTGFVGSGTRPTPLSRREVERILGVRKDEEKKTPRFKPDWEVGETVRVIDGPFADFNGIIEDINVDQSKVRVLVDIFGRETPVELNFEQIQKF